MTPDGKRFLTIKAPGTDATGTPPALIVVQHWDEELKTHRADEVTSPPSRLNPGLGDYSSLVAKCLPTEAIRQYSNRSPPNAGVVGGSRRIGYARSNA